jgi:hypothetical protein
VLFLSLWLSHRKYADSSPIRPSRLKNFAGCGSSRKSKTKAQQAAMPGSSCSFVRHAAESEVLIEALFDFYVDAEGAVLVAQGDYRDVAIHVVFDLNDLLLG